MQLTTVKERASTRPKALLVALGVVFATILGVAKPALAIDIAYPLNINLNGPTATMQSLSLAWLFGPSNDNTKNGTITFTGLNALMNSANNGRLLSDIPELSDYLATSWGGSNPTAMKLQVANNGTAPFTYSSATGWNLDFTNAKFTIGTNETPTEDYEAILQPSVGGFAYGLEIDLSNLDFGAEDAKSSGPNDFSGGCVSITGNTSANITGITVTIDKTMTENEGGAYKAPSDAAVVVGTTNGTVTFGEGVSIDTTNLTDHPAAIEVSGGTVDIEGATITSNPGPGKGVVTVTGGDLTIGGGAEITSSSENKSHAVVVQGAETSVTVNDATIAGPTPDADTDTSLADASGIYVTGGDLTINAGANISGNVGVRTWGGASANAEITMTGGTVTGNYAGMYLPTKNGQTNDVTVSGGSVTGPVGIVNLGTDLTVDGTASVSSNAPAGSAGVTIGSSGGPYPPAGIVAAQSNNTGYSTDTTQTTVSGDATVSGGANGNALVNGVGVKTDAATGNAPTNASSSITVTGNATVQGNVENKGAGTANLESGTITGSAVNSAKPDPNKLGSGSMNVGDQTTGKGPTIAGNLEDENGNTTIYGGKVDGEISGDVTNQTPPPVEEQGTQGAIDQQVEGAVGPVESLMAGSATVTPSDDNSVWTVEITNGEMPISSVANNLVYQVVSALLRAGADPVTSVQDPNLAVEPGDDYQQVLGFCTAVLQNSVAAADALPDDATLADLSGMECGVVATLADGSTTSYVFQFEGEVPPTPPIQQVVNVYRLYNPFDHLHLYTTDTNEVATLKSIGWSVDFNGQPAWVAPVAGGELADYEVVRLYNPNNGDHYFVKASDTQQLQILTRLGWQQEGSGASIWSAAPSTSDVQVYTLFNRFNQVDTHLYTASQTELNALVGPNAWEQQESVFWGVPQPLQ